MPLSKKLSKQNNYNATLKPIRINNFHSALQPIDQKFVKIKEPKARYAQVPGYWVKNINALQNILENIVYFDLLPVNEFWNVYISDVTADDPEHENRRLIIMSMTDIDIKTNFPDIPATRFPQVGDFWEPSVIAAVLTAYGTEVMYGVQNATCQYLSFTDALASKVFDHENNKDINQIVGTSEIMETPPIKRLDKPKGCTSIYNLMNPDELD